MYYKLLSPIWIASIHLKLIHKVLSLLNIETLLSFFFQHNSKLLILTIYF